MARRLFFSSLTPFTILTFGTFNADLYLCTLMSSDTASKGLHHRKVTLNNTKDNLSNDSPI